MTQDARDHRLLGDGGNDPERATAAQGTRGHACGPWECGPETSAFPDAEGVVLQFLFEVI
jgi:hypothetical protein